MCGGGGGHAAVLRASLSLPAPLEQLVAHCTPPPVLLMRRRSLPGVARSTPGCTQARVPNAQPPLSPRFSAVPMARGACARAVMDFLLTAVSSTTLTWQAKAAGTWERVQRGPLASSHPKREAATRKSCNFAKRRCAMSGCSGHAAQQVCPAPQQLCPHGSHQHKREQDFPGHGVAHGDARLQFVGAQGRLRCMRHGGVQEGGAQDGANQLRWGRGGGGLGVVWGWGSRKHKEGCDGAGGAGCAGTARPRPCLPTSITQSPSCAAVQLCIREAGSGSATDRHRAVQ